MLVTKGVTPGSVVTIKLTSGEELVSRLVTDSANELILSNPMVLTATSTGVGLAPYLFTGAEVDVPLNRATVTVVVPTRKESADQYLQATTGIKLV